jgi:glycosyltransferase involved in cell wall biosynthesis
MRGWPQLVEAVARSSEPFEVWFVGQFNDGSETAFHERTAELGIADRMKVVPWLPFEEAFKLVCSSDAGIVAFQPGCYNHIHALPHKMFDYMVAGIPVLAPAFAQEVSRIVRDADCGLLFDSSDPSSIRAALEVLAREPRERIRLGNNGRNAIRSLFNWENEYGKLERMYLELAGCSRDVGDQAHVNSVAGTNE